MRVLAILSSAQSVVYKVHDSKWDEETNHFFIIKLNIFVNRKRKMVNFDLGEEIERYFSSCQKRGTEKKFPWGMEPQTLGFCALMLYHWVTETLWRTRPLKSSASSKFIIFFTVHVIKALSTLLIPAICWTYVIFELWNRLAQQAQSLSSFLLYMWKRLYWHCWSQQYAGLMSYLNFEMVLLTSEAQW